MLICKFKDKKCSPNNNIGIFIHSLSKMLSMLILITYKRYLNPNKGGKFANYGLEKGTILKKTL